MQGAGIDTRSRGARIGIAARVVAVVLAVSGCHASAAGDTAGGSSHGSAAAQDAGHAPVSQAEIAARANADGERLMRDGRYDAAAQKFGEASARWPEVAYIINDCTARFRAGHFELALRFCQGARNNSPTPAQRAQIDTLIKQIVEAARQNGLELCDGCVSGGPGAPPTR